LFDPLAHPEADGVSGLGRDSIGHGAAPVRGDVPGDVRLDARRPRVAHEVLRVIGFVRPERRAFRREAAPRHRQCRLPLGGVGRQRDLGVDDEAFTVLFQPMRHVAQLRGLPLGLLVQAGFRVVGRCMGGVAPLLAPEVDVRAIRTRPTGRGCNYLALVQFACALILGRRIEAASV